MNKTNFIQTGGWPLKTERLQEMQAAYQTLNAFGSLAGDLTIISGCELVGSTVKKGFVYIDNELLEFREAVVGIDSTVIIIEENVDRAFKNGVVKTVHKIRYATIGTNPEASWLWSDFKKPFETKNIPKNLVTELKKIEGKEDKTTVDALIERIEALEEKEIPKIKVVSGISEVSNPTNGNLNNDYSKNYVHVFPPAGYTMAHLVGFSPSIAQILFSGAVNGDDMLWCKHTTDANKVIITCSASETRYPTAVQYIGIWIKY